MEEVDEVEVGDVVGLEVGATDDVGARVDPDVEEAGEAEDGAAVASGAES